MKRTISILALCLGTALFAGGCSRTNDEAPLPRGSQDSSSPMRGNMSTPALPAKPYSNPADSKSSTTTPPMTGQSSDNKDTTKSGTQ